MVPSPIRELDRQSRAVAAQLQVMGLEGERALLLYPPGLEYLVAFFGCLYAGVIAVPAYPPRNQRNTPRILTVVKDAAATIALTTRVIQSRLQSLLVKHEDLADLHWLTTDALAEGTAEEWQPLSLRSDSLAFLQYTSGSTSTPKGVMLSHGNLLHNAAATYELMGHSPESVFVSWLPVYHDMGLIGGILQPLYGAFPCILMPSASFLQRPYRWLQTISRYRGTTSGAPNFAYELCVDKVTPEQQQSLDLSSWTVAFNGAEPVRSQALEQFATKFSTCGFRSRAFYPCYGMAEATLMVSGGRHRQEPVVKPLQRIDLEHNRVVVADDQGVDQVQSLVGCGQTLPQQQIVITHPETQRRCESDEVGEIWVSGPSVGQGYWQRPEETEGTFRAYLADTGAGPFLRTGDFGFLDGESLFVTGRVKDMIIMRGRNLYPQDIELTAERSHPALRLGGVAAFSIDHDGAEQLVVVQELEFRQKPDFADVTRCIRQAIATEHEVHVYAVVLIQPGTIAKTSSGKIQRRACRHGFLHQTLAVVHGDMQSQPDLNIEVNSDLLTRVDLLAMSKRDRQSQLAHDLQQRFAQITNRSADHIDLHQPLSSLGLDSLMAMQLKNTVETDFAIAIAITDWFEEISLAELTDQLLQQLSQAAISKPALLARSPHETIPLSLAQERLWFLDQLEANTPVYNLAATVELIGNLEVSTLHQSLNALIERHEILRTAFVATNNQPVQVITAATLTLPVVDLQSLLEAEQRVAIQEAISRDAQQPFDLAQAPLLRAKLLRLSANQHQLVLTVHHIIFDGWSLPIFLRELGESYQALRQKQPVALSPLSIQYGDFSIWQRQGGQDEVIAAQLHYWQQQLSGELPVLDLPTDYLRPATPTFRGARRSFQLSPALTQALKALSQQEGVTLFMMLLAAFQTLLHRYSGQTDILIGSPIANRSPAETENLIGFFVNTLVLRSDLSGDPSFRSLLKQVRQVALDAYAHHDVPFAKLVEVLQPSRDLAHHPLFQVMLILQTAAVPPLELPELTLSLTEVDTGSAKFDLTLNLSDTPDGLSGHLEYSTDLLTASTIDRFIQHWQQLLASIIANPDLALSDLSLLPFDERHQLRQWNQTAVDYPSLSLQEIFEAQVTETPEAIALLTLDRQISYQQLNESANQLAHWLQHTSGIGVEDRIGVCLRRSPDLILTLLGILKTGAAYVPIDPNYPAERQRWMLSDARVTMLITQQAIAESIYAESNAEIKTVCLEQVRSQLATQATTNPSVRKALDNLAYLIYTSGSTGTPKGVMNTHHGLLNRLHWMWRTYPFAPDEVCCQKTSMSFVDAVAEIFTPLLQGVPLLLTPDEIANDPAQLVPFLAQHRVSRIVMVPSLLQAILSVPQVSQLAHLKLWISSGEALSAELVQRFRQIFPHAVLLNLYGCSEVAADATWATVSAGEIETIGHPIANTAIYLLDAALQPVPIGVVGEIYVGGAALARGYWQQPGWTADRFLPHPFATKPSERLYRTGDLGRYQSNGQIEFVGRADQQVKLRGYRIELGEIAAVLSRYADVETAIAHIQPDANGQPQLVAYGVPKAGKSLDVQQWRSFLQEQVPSWMVPAAFAELPDLPRLPNGKVNRRALQPVTVSQRAYEPPRTDIEQQLAQIWTAVLGVAPIGIHDDFFALGGHSLLATQVQSRIRDGLQVELPLRCLFTAPTLSQLAQYVELARTDSRNQKQPAAILPSDRAAYRRKLSSLAEPANRSSANAQQGL
ncbi:MAG: amino acid adenylation domain-containing protein [Leptolyngbya sp. SIOISBB]|nr:amino acid adenylation domain-containing protein [Leptolyngbya sp. SIOISBB]